MLSYIFIAYLSVIPEIKSETARYLSCLTKSLLINLDGFLEIYLNNLLIIIFPLFLAFIFALKIHDGLRYFLFLIPYLSIIPGLTIFYLFKNSKFWDR